MRALIAYHLQQMQAQSPPGSVYALGLSGLQRADVTVWSAWRGEALAAVGALRVLDDGGGELKSIAPIRMSCGRARLRRCWSTSWLPRAPPACTG
ncbi:hypothetical protein [Xanthomonas translucens]|uniref:hypothetical protein n=1 Tax=Xanthomonas campestris pv. translucens TaxID=343 RepID=UPI001E58366A|nr:hypothetical protein [Xanthomonas translucens]MCS3358947.1 hypothetical protein [Xanthomonas translucens pv. translucens]MCS3373116.1 hypothetical protein [Xanthomonas translucens pv. translucens]MCT8273460.1 hypothetical protein [Xanthomonas translucens pv. translucens]MCT8277605.1 hypothetical protein [Xanthomonas translucens pv. translucens]MCT8288386.1 hypothetical protein [Xanthomonas translucens pv. translucens]